MQTAFGLIGLAPPFVAAPVSGESDPSALEVDPSCSGSPAHTGSEEASPPPMPSSPGQASEAPNTTGGAPLPPESPADAAAPEPSGSGDYGDYATALVEAYTRVHSLVKQRLADPQPMSLLQRTQLELSKAHTNAFLEAVKKGELESWR